MDESLNTGRLIKGRNEGRWILKVYYEKLRGRRNKARKGPEMKPSKRETEKEGRRNHYSVGRLRKRK